MRKNLLLITMLLFSFSVLVFAQPKIKTFPVSPYMIAHGAIDTSLYKSSYNGLTTVGVGELVYLVSASPATVLTWEISAKPAGSNAALDFTVTPMVTFRPDMVGDFKVKLTIEGASDEITIVASNYVGNNETTCAPCHTGTIAEWKTTGHTTILTRGLNGTLSGHYAASCIECHTVGYDTDPAAVNGGFDDVAKNLGWVFPAHPEAGTFDALDASLKAVSNIQCENCHGAASQHKATFQAAKMDVTMDSGMCARCHDDGHYHRRPTMWEGSGHAESTALSGATRAGCNDCHDGTRFAEKMDSTPPAKSKVDTKNPSAIGCAVCHDPHDSHDNHDPMKNSAGQEAVQVHQLRNVVDISLSNGEVVTIGGSGRLCMNCHKGRREAASYVDGSGVSSHFGPHYSTQTDMILGTNAITFGRYIPSSTHRDVMPNFCVTCHMAETPGGRSGFGTYGRDKIGDHSFNMHWAGDDGVEGNDDDVYNVGVCQNCHGANIVDFESFQARKDYDHDGKIETARDELHGLLEEVEEFFPKKADGTVDYTPAKWSPVQRRALFNHAMVEEDKSMGMHNYQFAVGLLQVTLEALEYGELVKGAITMVTDVPNDQGKQVFVSWSRFGGDGVSNNPVEDYMVLRKDEIGLAKTKPMFNSFDEIHGDISGIELGSKIMDNGVVWTYVGRYRAAQMFEYNVVAPTLYDSTAAGTMESTFKVIGITANGETAETDEVSGYSIDNLSPMVPGNLAGAFSESVIKLNWDEPVDADFQYFAVYKGATADLAGEPYATTTSNSFVDQNVTDGTVFYSVAAVDFAGNISAKTSAVNFTITDVASDLGTPTAFTLSQNYPNPFNPTTTIKFGIPEQAHVKVTIYDAVGKVVDVLVNQPMSTGYYSYEFNASNLASGVYFYEIQAGNFRQVNKMMLMK